MYSSFHNFFVMHTTGLCNGKDTLKPAVIIELFFAYQIDIPDKESIVSSIKYALLDTIQCTKHK